MQNLPTGSCLSDARAEDPTQSSIFTETLSNMIETVRSGKMTDRECLHLCTIFSNERRERLEQEKQCIHLCTIFSNEMRQRLEQGKHCEEQAKLNQVCKAMSKVLIESLIHNAVSYEAKVYYYTVLGDCHFYMAGGWYMSFSNSDTLKAYWNACLGSAGLPPSRTLQWVLNCSILFDETDGQKFFKAC